MNCIGSIIRVSPYLSIFPKFSGLYICHEQKGLGPACFFHETSSVYSNCVVCH